MRITKTFFVGMTLALITWSAVARDLVWDGKTYLDIGLQLGADTTLVFPEPIEYTAEVESAFSLAKSGSDERILSVRPLTLHEQRVTFIGRKSKTIYLARFSTRASYSPIYRITDATAAPVTPTRAASSTGLTPTGMMRLMMAGTPAQGISKGASVQTLVEGAEYKIATTEVWESPGLTGIIGSATLVKGVNGATIRPSDISLKIPGLGQLRMMGADCWDLQCGANTTMVYFAFTT